MQICQVLIYLELIYPQLTYPMHCYMIVFLKIPFSHQKQFYGVLICQM